MWYCYFVNKDEVVLRTKSGWDSAEAAAMWGSSIIRNPDAYKLFDPDDNEVPAVNIDFSKDFTIEKELAPE